MTLLTLGMAVSALSLQTLDGRNLTMNNYAERRGTMVLFMSVRSPAFRAALPGLLAVYEKHRRDEVLYVGICINPAESAAEIRAYLQRHHVNFPVYRDPDSAIAKRFGPTVTPEGFLIDPAGTYRFHAGFQDAAALARTEAAAAALVRGEAPSTEDGPVTGSPIGYKGQAGPSSDPIAPVHFVSEMVFDKIPWAPDHHCSTLAEAPNGDLLCVWYGGTYEVADDEVLYMARRRKGSRVWARPEVISRGVYLKPPGNAIIFRCSPTRLMIIYDRLTESRPIRAGRWHGGEVWTMSSDDSGKTWSPERRMAFGGGMRNLPITLSSGELYVPSSAPKASFMITRDQGKSWSLSGLIDAGGQPTVVQRSDGSLLCYLRSQPWILQSESHDRGMTWTPTRPTTLPCPGAAIALCRLRNGHLLLMFDDHDTYRFPISIARSTDDGKTWGRPVKIETNPGQYAYPCLMQTADGRIHASYTWMRLTIKHIEFNERWLEVMSGE